MDFLVVEAEGLPDIAGGRRVFGLSPDTPDKTVAKVMFHHQLHRYEGATFLPPHLRALVVVCLLRCRDEELQLDTLVASQNEEPEMLEAIASSLARSGEAVYWDGGRGFSSWLLGRAMVTERTLAPLTTLPLEPQLGLDVNRVNRAELASRFDIACDAVPADEANWDQFRQTGYRNMAVRCARNTLATARIFLRQRMVSSAITEEDHRLFSQRLDDLVHEHTSKEYA